LQELTTNIENMFHVSCRLRCPAPVLITDNAAATHLFRIAQEAVSNAIKHGHARRVEIELTAGREDLQLSVSDDGGGLPSENQRSEGMGLRIMEYRAGMIGGTLSLRPNPGGGTIVTCSAPATLLAKPRAR
jgi:signal transduction histidine kinase